uniref:Zmp:0000000924 n=1 Tax=Cyprinus carpio TaxID=7962 RepID=A0A8C1YS11_CYPCA
MGTKMSQPVYGNINTDGARDMDRRNKRIQTPQHTGTNTNNRRSILNITWVLISTHFISILACTLYSTQVNGYKYLTLLFTDKWFYYQLSFYYMSNETKNWTESRQDCLKKGADLIIINNSTEHVSERYCVEFWIGVTDIDVEDRWKWVDGSNLTSGSSEHLIGGIKEPGGGTTENCAVTYLKDHPNLLGWHDVKCNDAYQGICEKSILPLLQP